MGVRAAGDALDSFGRPLGKRRRDLAHHDIAPDA
jgi:hypothetical protein